MTPISLIDAKSIVPTFYKMFYFRTKCTYCGIIHSHDEVFAAMQLVSGVSMVPLKNMADIHYNLPVKVETINKTSPFCHMCWNPEMLKHLPMADAAKQRPITPSWAGTGVNPNSAAAKAHKTKPDTKPKKKVYTGTIDDLDID